MEDQSPQSDYDLAQRVCKDLRCGRSDALMELYSRFQNFFAAFATRRLFNAEPNQVDEVLSNFWVELLNCNAICNFKGQSSLRTFLTVILNRRIIDANRKYGRDKLLRENIENAWVESAAGSLSSKTPDNILLEKETQRLVNITLEQLEKVAPRDADLIKMHLDGLTYEEMAQKEMRHDNFNPKKLKKKTNAIKKQFTRDSSGSLAKFKGILKRTLAKESLGIGDLY